MKITIQAISVDKYTVFINGYPIESFDRFHEAEALQEQLLLLGEEVIENIFS